VFSDFFQLPVLHSYRMQTSALSNAEQLTNTHGLKYQPSEWSDAQILRAYMQQRQGDRYALTRVARALAWPKWAVAKRGAQLGVTRTKEAPWSGEELELLERFGHLTCAGIQARLRRAGFKRSWAAIQLKRNRLHITANLDGYSATSLAKAFGIDVHRVLTWIRRGLLRAERRTTGSQECEGGNQAWWIPRTAVKKFVMRAPEEIDLARVEKIWFLDLLTDGKICR